MIENPVIVDRRQESALATNKVLRNTYMLLSMTLLFSGLTAGISMAMQLPLGVYLGSVISAFLLIWLVLPRVAKSGAGIVAVFAITGLLGVGLGPLLNYYTALANGSQIITLALGGTGVIFVGLSAYVLTTKKDFSFMGGFLMAGFLVILVAAIANIFFQIPALSLTISSAIILIMSGFILYDTSRIIHGGETNYIMATVGLYLSLYNIFVSLLHILGIFGGND